MRRRLLEALGVVTVLATVMVLLQLTTVSVRGPGSKCDRVGTSEPGGHLARCVLHPLRTGDRARRSRVGDSRRAGRTGPGPNSQPWA